MLATDFILKNFNVKTDTNPNYIHNLHRDKLPIVFQELGFKIGVELGTSRGVYAETICQNCAGVKLFTIDPYLPSEHINSSVHDEAKARLAPYNYEMIVKKSNEAVHQFEDESIDFVYIDGNHMYDYTMEDIITWNRKVKLGGIVAGHDYRRYASKISRRWKVIEAINHYTSMHNINPWFIFGKTDTDRRCPSSWMFEKIINDSW